MGEPSLSAASEGRRRGSSFRSLSGVAALSSARSSAAFMSLRRESSGLLSCPVIIGSWRELGAQAGGKQQREEEKKGGWEGEEGKKNPPLVRCSLAVWTLAGYFSGSVSTHSLYYPGFCLLCCSLITLPLSPAPSLPGSLFLSEAAWCCPADAAAASAGW